MDGLFAPLVWAGLTRAAGLGQTRLWPGRLAPPAERAFSGTAAASSLAHMRINVNTCAGALLNETSAQPLEPRMNHHLAAMRRLPW